MKLHLGCGKRYIPGYFHIDGFDGPHIDHVCSIDDLSFIEDNSIDLIYACHVIEHFKRARLPQVLKEWNRVLKKGGKLRLAVPDFEAIVKALAAKEYEGWFVVEAEQDPKVSPPLEMATKGHAELLRVMSAAGYEVE